jgi:hypothetical protein
VCVWQLDEVKRMFLDGKSKVESRESNAQIPNLVAMIG